MSGLLNLNRHEGGMNPFLLNPDASLQPNEDIACDHEATSAHIALCLHDRTLSQPTESYFQQSLIVTVQLDPPMVRQHWLLDAAPSISAYRRTRNESSPRTYDTVQYQLSKTTLDAYADSQGMARIAPEGTAASFACPVFARLTHLILIRLETPQMFSLSFMDHFISLFCARVMGLRGERTASQEIYRGGLSTWQKRRAIEFLAKESEINVTLPLLARQCDLSVSHFARSFKKSFGLPVRRWVIKQRVERAKSLLMRSDESLLEIALQSGFGDQASFNRTFAKLTGLSPGRWRRDFKQ